jgi:hypothetical protein
MILNFLFFGKKQSIKQTSEDKGEFIIRLGREQFKKLVAKGLKVPVVFL